MTDDVQAVIDQARRLLGLLEEFDDRCPACGANGSLDRRYNAQAVRLRDAILDFDSAERARRARA